MNLPARINALFDRLKVSKDQPCTKIHNISATNAMYNLHSLCRLSGKCLSICPFKSFNGSASIEVNGTMLMKGCEKKILRTIAVSLSQYQSSVQ